MGNCNMVCFYQNKTDILINNQQILNNSFNLEKEEEGTKVEGDLIENQKKSSAKEIFLNKKKNESKDSQKLYRSKRINSNDLVFNNSFLVESDSFYVNIENEKKFLNSHFFFYKINLKGFSEKEKLEIFNKFYVLNQIKKIQKNFKIFLDTKFNSINLFKKENKINLNFAFKILKSIKYDDGSIYKGQIKSQKRKGIGIILDENYKFYGNFENDTAEGFGEMCNNNGFVFLGNWRSFKLNGFGRITNKINGTIFEGELKDSTQNGFGIEKWVSDSSFIGEYSSDAKNGIGILKFSDNSLYEGEFKNEDMNGIGKYLYIDGSSYSGEWKNNKMHGYGIFTWNDGRNFQGEFIEDKKEGFGIMRNKQNSIYFGYWMNNFLEGEGCILTKGKVKKFIFLKSKKIKALADNYYIQFEDFIFKYLNKENQNQI